MNNLDFGVWVIVGLVLLWSAVICVWVRWGKRLARMDMDEDIRPFVSCNSCARLGNGCPIAPRDYAAPIKCCEHRPMGTKRKVVA